MIINEKEYLHQLHNSLGVAIFAVKIPERIIEYVNPAIKDVFGYSAKECLGKSTKIIYPSRQDYLKYGELVSESIQQNKKIVNLEFKLKKKNGEVFLAEITTSFIKKNDKIFSAVSIIKDITLQKELEEKLRLSEQRYKELTELLPEAVFEADIDANLTYANQQAFQISGYTKQDLKNGLNGIDLLVPEDRKRAKENLAKRLQGKKIGINEYKALRKDGSILPVLMHTSPIFFQGTIKGVRGIIIDISQRKNAEEELNKYRNHLEELVDTRTKELKQKTVNLEEVNIALKVLLEQRKKDKKDIEKSIYNNIEKLVNPYLEKLKDKVSDPTGNSYLDIMESNLKEITSLFSPGLSEEITKLTPAELQIANLIKHGKTTKEIAELLSLSKRTINFHRENIRNKLGLKNQKVNLRSHLMTIS
jgi:PAS domain S-box-containing protein